MYNDQNELRIALSKAMLNAPEERKTKPTGNIPSGPTPNEGALIAEKYLKSNVGDIIPFKMTSGVFERKNTSGLIVLELVDSGMKSSIYGLCANLQELIHMVVALYYECTAEQLSQEDLAEVLFTGVGTEIVRRLVMQDNPAESKLKTIEPFLAALAEFAEKKIQNESK